MSNKIYIGTPTSAREITQLDPWGGVHNTLNSLHLLEDLEFVEYTQCLGSNKPWFYVLAASNTGELDDKWGKDLLPPGVYEEIVDGNCSLIVYNYAESHLCDAWLIVTRNLFERMIQTDQIPASKIKWISNGIGGQQAFDDFCERENLWNPGVKHITFTEFLIADPHQWNVSNFPKRKFLYLQKVHRHHRVALAMWMHKHNIDAYMSHHLTEFTSEVVKISALDYRSLELNNDDVEKFMLSLPWEVDGANLDHNTREHLCPVVPENPQITYAMERSGIHIIGETYFRDPAVFFSEKTYKPIMLRKPFIILGQHRSLETLRDLGFKTFAPYIDESYDQISDPQIRMRAVANEISRLDKLSAGEFSKQLGHMEDACEHNFHVIQDFRKRSINLDELL